MEANISLIPSIPSCICGKINIQTASSMATTVVHITNDALPCLVLSGQEVEDLSISEPDLEEIFMHYYKETV